MTEADISILETPTSVVFEDQLQFDSHGHPFILTR